MKFISRDQHKWTGDTNNIRLKKIKRLRFKTKNKYNFKWYEWQND